MSFIELNPEYEYLYFDDQMARNFIKKHYTEDVVIAYDMLNPGAYRADLFRYCYLNKYGGCYFDCKMILREPIRNFIYKLGELIVCEDRIQNAYYNAFILTDKNKFNKVIEKCVDNILHKKYPGLWAITGPHLFYSELIEEEKLALFKYVNIQGFKAYQNDTIIDTRTDKVIITNNYLHYSRDRYLMIPHYSIQYQTNNVYYNLLYQDDQYYIYLLGPKLGPKNLKVTRINNSLKFISSKKGTYHVKIVDNNIIKYKTLNMTKISAIII